MTIMLTKKDHYYKERLAYFFLYLHLSLKTLDPITQQILAYKVILGKKGSSQMCYEHEHVL